MATDTCEMDIRVRYVEADQMGYVHHSKYAVYFEMGRTELLRNCDVSYREMEQSGAFFVVARLDIRYLSAARYDDVLRLVTRTKRLTRVRIEHEYELYRKNDNVLLAKAQTVLASVDGSGQVVPIPDRFFNKLQKH